jgi:hypothetical protein
MRVASVFHLAGVCRAAKPTARVEDIPVEPPSKPPPICLESPTFIPKGCGPWQRKAKAMLDGESLVLSLADGDSFRGACRRLGIKTMTRRKDEHHVQVWIFPDTY